MIQQKTSLQSASRKCVPKNEALTRDALNCVCFRVLRVRPEQVRPEPFFMIARDALNPAENPPLKCVPTCTQATVAGRTLSELELRAGALQVAGLQVSLHALAHGFSLAA